MAQYHGFMGTSFNEVQSQRDHFNVGAVYRIQCRLQDGMKLHIENTVTQVKYAGTEIPL